MALHVIVNAENTTRRDALDRVTRGLARLGVRLVPEPLPRGEFVARARDKSFDAVLYGWRVGTRIEPQAWLHTRAAANRGNNLVSWSTPASDALLNRASRARTREEAAPLWKAWQQIFREEQPHTILYEERTLIGLSARVLGATPSTLDPYHRLHEWELRQER